MDNPLSKTIQRLQKVKEYLDNDAKTIIGVEALNHFKESFKNQGFTDQQLQKWDEVERRKPDSDWRGFSYGSNVSRGKKRRKENSVTNYSPAAESRPILSGETQDLMNSLSWEKTSSGIRVYAKSAYAKIHNEGGPMKIFGKTASTMPKRQFMGKSKQLRDRLREIILTDIKNLLK